MIDLGAIAGRTIDETASRVLAEILRADPSAALAALRLLAGDDAAAGDRPLGDVTLRPDAPATEIDDPVDFFIEGGGVSVGVVARVTSEGIDEVAAAVTRLLARDAKRRAFCVIAPADATGDYRDAAVDRFERKAKDAVEEAVESGALPIRSVSWGALLDAICGVDGADASTAGLAAGLAAFVGGADATSEFEFDAGTGIAFGETSYLEALTEAQGREAHELASWSLDRARQRGLRLEWRRFAPKNACIRFVGRHEGRRWRAVAIYLDGRILIRAPGADGPDARVAAYRIADATAAPEVYRKLIATAIDLAAGITDESTADEPSAAEAGGKKKASPSSGGEATLEV